VFIKCDLKKTDFSKSRLESAVFEKCNLTGAFRGVDIAGVNFEGSVIDKTVLDMSGFVSFGKGKGFVLG